MSRANHSRAQRCRNSCQRLSLAILLSLPLLPFPGCAHGVRNTTGTACPACGTCKPATLRYVECRHGVVVCVSGPAADAGRAILERGGNAVDAGVATAFALMSAYPLSGAIGGGGFMIVHPGPGRGKPTVFDYRECAPAAASAHMFGRDESQYTRRAVAVPGTVRGMALAHTRFGTLPWRTLLQPAIRIAREGVILDRNLTNSMNDTLAASPGFAEFQRIYGKPGGGKWKVGDRLVQPDLSRTLTLLADLGPDAFYTGPIADEIIAEMKRGNGLITPADLAAYRAIERQPLHTRYRGEYDVYVPPPPSSGGACLVEELNVLNCFDLPAWGRWSPTTLHVMVEAMRRANYDRARYLGDPGFVKIPAKLISPAYGRQLAASIDLHKATPSVDLSAGIPLSREGKSTTHFSIVDRDGMAVGNTFTLERRWGSRIVVKNAGFLLNNDMWGFNLFPGVTDTHGNLGTPPNTIAPGKRMLSSMTPTIVARGGRVFLVTGSPGSQAIPHTVLEIIVNVVDFHMPIQEAVEATRFSHQWFPDQITFERPEDLLEAMQKLKKMGHKIVRTGPFPQGDAHTILVVKPHCYIGVADDRLNGRAAGY